MLRWLATWIIRLGLVLAGTSILAVLLGRLVDPPLTPLMALRTIEGLAKGRLVGVAHRSVPLEEVSPSLLRAVIAAEDARFFQHRGIDWRAVRAAREWNVRHPEQPRGASTITMQCARSAFLWPGRTWLRKGVEVWFTTLMELFWPKRRILEVYLNVVEWGDGVYGVAAAAERWFGRPAARLDPAQAALLAAVLPSPRRWKPDAPTATVRRRAAVISRRAGAVGLAPLGDGE